MQRSVTKEMWLPLLLLLLLEGGGDCQYKVHRQDPFALLSGTLQTYQEAACDDQNLHLECPVGTKIAIQLVQYGRSAPSDQVCPPTKEYPLSHNTPGPLCTFPEALKYVEERCHGKESCSLLTSPSSFGFSSYNDPCPGYRKYAEVAFKCKPVQFKSRVVCHSETLRLECSEEEERIAVYSAAFAAAANSHVYCPVSSGAAAAGSAGVRYRNMRAEEDEKYGVSDVEKCEASHATEAVMQMCHGQKSCVILADGSSLGAPACSSAQNVYLKTVFACVNSKVLKAQYIQLPTTATTSRPITTTTTTTPTYDDIPESMLGDLSIFPVEKEEEIEEEEEEDEDQEEEKTDKVVNFVSDFFSSLHHLKQHKSRYILLATLSVALGLTLFLALLIWGLYRSSRLSRIKCAGNGNVIQNNHVSPIHAFYSSSPLHPPSPYNLDLETEVGDHEVDSAFRDPAPEPLILAPVSRSPPSDTMMTMRRSCSTRESLLLLQQPEFNRMNDRVVRYSTIGRPRVSSPSSSSAAAAVANGCGLYDCDLADPRSLTISRACSEQQDHLLYG